MSDVKHRIVTTHEYPPIPTRAFDWRATFDWFDGDDDQPTGWGETEDKAVLDLLNEASEWDDDGSCMEEIVNLAFAGWRVAAEANARLIAAAPDLLKALEEIVRQFGDTPGGHMAAVISATAIAKAKGEA